MRHCVHQLLSDELSTTENQVFPSFWPIVGKPVAGGVNDMEDRQNRVFVVQRVSNDVGKAIDGFLVGAADTAWVAGRELSEGVACYAYPLRYPPCGRKIVTCDVDDLLFEIKVRRSTTAHASYSVVACGCYCCINPVHRLLVRCNSTRFHISKTPLDSFDDLQFPIHRSFDRFGREVGLCAACVLREATELLFEVGRHPNGHRRAGTDVTFLQWLCTS